MLFVLFRRVCRSALILVAAYAPLAAQNAETPNQQMLKTDLLVVTAHPDDESMMAATMARYADKSKVVSLVVCTRGEGGGNGTGKELGAALGVVREAELRRCVGILGVKYLYFLNQPDWAYTESVQATLDKWGSEATLRSLVRLVRLLRPEVICTMDPTPVGGQHGHHQAAGRAATEAFAAAADPAKFSDQIEEEGLAPWRVKKLYWVSFMGGALQIRADEVATGALGALRPGKSYGDIAALAEANHRSQGFDKFFEMMQPGQNFLARPNGFALIKSRVPVDPKAEKDLFDGISGAVVQENNLLDTKPVLVDAPNVEFSFQPLPAWQNFNAWLTQNGLASRIRRKGLPTYALAAGRPSPIAIELINRTSRPQKALLRLKKAPAGWRIEGDNATFTVPPNQTVQAAFVATPPLGTPQSRHDVTLELENEGQVQTLTEALEVLPQAFALRLPSAFPVDADLDKWAKASVSPVLIPHTHNAQGAARDDNEHSGRFFVGYDGEGLQVLIDVTDDTVVSNIAPDDIKGHWRTTSAEICIDPGPRAENTFSTLKLGIFPQDIMGKVRAGRDADANPGPIDKKEPSILLASRITPTGYIVEARIPWKALRTRLPFSPVPGRPLGFNVILFHAGKKQARVGEDIGKSRLAWSVGSGVWGRPEIWGTLVLK